MTKRAPLIRRKILKSVWNFTIKYEFWYSFDARAHAAQNYGAFVAQNPEVQESMDKLVSCEGTRSFVFETMFNNLPPTES